MSNSDFCVQGQKVFLRPVTLSDAVTAYVGWLNDKEVNRFLETRHKEQTPESVRAYIKATLAREDELFLAICLKENNLHIGNIKIGPINLIHGFGDISLFIGDKDKWGKGYATEAIKLISQYAFDNLGLHKLTAGCYECNIASIKAFEKAGFKKEFSQRKQYLFEGEYIDRVCLTLFPEGLN